MAMKLRIVIFKPEHTNDVFILKPKMMTTDKMFKRGNSSYLLNADNFQITFDKPWWRGWTTRYFTTYYYALNHPNPLPVPLFGTDGKQHVGADGKPLSDPMKLAELGPAKATADSLVEGEELAAMFEAWLWRTIAGPAKSLVDSLHFYISAATLAGVIFIMWKLSQGEAPTGEEIPATEPIVSGA